MVALFVVATILLCVGIEYLRDRAKQHQPVAEAARSSHDRILVPKGFFVSRAHSWVEITFAGEARIGIDDFAQKVIGTIQRIETAPLGTSIKKGETLLTLRNGKRVLSIPAPISGTILSVNDSILSSPRRIHQDPYVQGWIAVIAPSSISHELRLLAIADEAAQWLKSEVNRFRDFIKSQTQSGIPSPAGVTMLDGGAPLSGVLEQFNENTWKAFQQEFLNAE